MHPYNFTIANISATTTNMNNTYYYKGGSFYLSYFYNNTIDGYYNLSQLIEYYISIGTIKNTYFIVGMYESYGVRAGAGTITRDLSFMKVNNIISSSTNF